MVTISLVLSHLTLNSWYRNKYCHYLIQSLTFANLTMQTRCSTQSMDPIRQSYITLCWKGLPGTNILAYFGPFSEYWEIISQIISCLWMTYEWARHELRMRLGFNFFGILSHLRMSQAWSVNEMCANFVGREFKFRPN